MVELIKGYSLNIIRTKLIILYILNVTDIVFTFILLSTGLFYEANALVNITLNNPILTILIKLGLPAFLLGLIYFRINKATTRQLFISNIVLSIGLAVYLLVNLSHLFWMSSLIIN